MTSASKYQLFCSQRQAIWLFVALSLSSHLFTSAFAKAGTPKPDVRLANDLYHAGQYYQATEILDQLLEPANVAKLTSPALNSALELAVEVNQASGRFDVALQYAIRRQQFYANQTKDASTRSNAEQQATALTIADLQMSLDRPAEAEKSLLAALALPDGARLNDPLWEANTQVKLARAIAAQKNVLHQREANPRSIQQWSLAEKFSDQAVDFCLRNNSLPTQLVSAVKLQDECLLALNHADEAASRVESVLQSNASSLDTSSRIDLNDELAQCRHAQYNFNAERTVLEQELEWQQLGNQAEPIVAKAALLNRLATVNLALNEDHLAEKNWKNAADLYHELLNQSEETPNARNKPDSEFLELQCLQGLQEIDLRLARWADGVLVSRQLLQRLEPRLRSDDPSLIRAKTALGAFLAKTEDWGSARPLLHQAAEYWRSRVPHAPAELAGTLVNLAEVAQQSGDFVESQSLLEKALQSYRLVLAADDIKLANTLSNLATVKNARGQFHEALANFREAESICHAQANVGNRQANELLAVLLLNLSMLYKSQRQFDAAAATCEQSLALAQKQHPVEADVALLPFHIALASLYLAEDDSSLDETMISTSQVSVTSFTNIATPETQITALQRADFHVRSALDICAQHKLLQNSAAANVLYQAAMLQYRKGDLDAAQEKWQTALQIAQHTSQTAVVFRCLSYLGQLAVKKGNFDDAEAISRQAVQLQEVVQAYPAMHFMSLVNRAQVLHKLGQKDEALDCLQEAVQVIESPRAETTGGEAQRAVYFAQFSAAFDLLVDWSVEEKHWDDALSYAEAGRNRTFLDQVRAVGVDLRASLRGTPQEHLLTDEQRILSQYHALQAEAIERLSSDDSPFDTKQATKPTEPDASDALNGLSNKISNDPTELTRRLVDLRKQYAEIQTAIRDASPFYREVLLADRGSQAWSALRAQALSPDSAMLFYYLGQTGGHLFLIDGKKDSGSLKDGDPVSEAKDNSNSEVRSGNDDDVVHYSLTVSPDQAAHLGIPPGLLSRKAAAHLVLRYVTTLCQSEQARGSNRGLGSQAISSAKYCLGPDEQLMITDIFVPPAAREELRRRNPRYVVIIPDGALHQLPIEALSVSADSPRYLLDEFPPIAYAPSAMILAALQQRKSINDTKDFSLLTVGNPRYPEVDPAVSRSSSDVALADYIAAGGTLSPLPGTSSECHKVAASLRSAGVSDMSILEDLNASEHNVREHLAGRRIVHLATHGLVDQQNQNLFGALALTQPDNFQNTTTENDGFLSLFEIYGLPLKDCELVMLSACQTNVGPDRPLEAGSTMARAFLAAGARRVVCSHWDVDDESTSELIGAFAAAISESLRAGEKPNYAVALAEARKFVRQQPKWSAPYYWSPLVLIGPAK